MELEDDDEMMQSDGAGGDKQEVGGVFSSLAYMKMDVEGLRNPRGTYNSPARTCKELWMLQPDLPDGGCGPSCSA